MIRGFLIAGLATASLLAQSRPAEFEVASIRMTPGDALRAGPLTVSGSLLRLEGYTVFGLILDAYQVDSYQLAFSPELLRRIRPEDVMDTRYDISARAPGSEIPSMDRVREMLQTLLAKRFGLGIRRETRQTSVYALTARDRPPTLKLSSSTAPCVVRERRAVDGRNDEETFTGCPVQRLTEQLSNLVSGRPVVDESGLTGRYDFRIMAVPDSRSLLSQSPLDISPFSALEVLGLKVEKKEAAIGIIVVDSFQKPGEN